MPVVLVVDDELAIRRFLRAGLESLGYKLIEADSGRDAITQTAMRSPDLLLLDLGLPDIDGLEIVRRIREWSSVPIIVLSARENEGDKIRALDAGADDYVTKPFSMGELLARMRVALRKKSREGANEEDGTAKFGELRLDFARRRVTRAGEEVKLTPIEYRLLTALARRPGRVFTHEQLPRDFPGAGGRMEKLLWVGFGGFLGSILRYAIGGWVGRLKAGWTFPIETLLINVAGCVVLGALAGLGEARGVFSGTTRAFLFVGLLGGFTTFSTFGYETFHLLRDGQWQGAALSTALQVVLGIGGVWAGYSLARLAT